MCVSVYPFFFFYQSEVFLWVGVFVLVHSTGSDPLADSSRRAAPGGKWEWILIQRRRKCIIIIESMAKS